MEPFEESLTTPIDWEMVDQEEDDHSSAEALGVHEVEPEPVEERPQPQPQTIEYLPLDRSPLEEERKEEEVSEAKPEGTEALETPAEPAGEPAPPSPVVKPAAPATQPVPATVDEEPFEFVKKEDIPEMEGPAAKRPRVAQAPGSPGSTAGIPAAVRNGVVTAVSALDQVLDATGKAAVKFLSSGKRHKLFLPVFMAVFATGFFTGFNSGAALYAPEPIKVYLEMKGDFPGDFLDDFEKQLNKELTILKHPGVDLVPYAENKIDWTRTCLIFMVEMAETTKALDVAVKTRMEELSKKTGGNSVLSVVYKTDSVIEVNRVASSLSTQGARSSFHLELKRSRGRYDHKKNAAEARKFATNFANIKTHERPL